MTDLATRLQLAEAIYFRHKSIGITSHPEHMLAEILALSEPILAAKDAEIAEARRCMLLSDTEQTAVWNYLQKVSPWSESNDMLWSDEIITGIDGLLRDAERYLYIRNRMPSLRAPTFEVACPDGIAACNVCHVMPHYGEALDAATDAAIQALAGEGVK